MEYDNSFRQFCETIFSYQYVKNQTKINDAIMLWLYEHSSGNVSIVVSLIHDAQEISILNGRECLDLEALNEAYQKRLSLLHNFTNIRQKSNNLTSKKKPSLTLPNSKEYQGNSIADLISYAKNKEIDVVQVLKEQMVVVEVSI